MNLEEAKQLAKNINHIGFIMDGNRRWAVKNNLPKVKGHNQGVENLKNILELIKELNIKHTTFYTLSKDNKKKRGEEEYNNLMDLAMKQFDEIEKIFNEKEEEEIKKQTQNKKAKITIFGDYTTLREDVVKKLQQIENKTKDYNDFYINFCINYDGQDEIIQATKKLLAEKRDIEDITEKEFKKHLYTKNSPPPEIIIRCGNMPRLSGFLLWDSQYSEIYFSEKMWPEFNKDELFKVLDWFSKINRKFGK
jgi:undecaprenyl diphosphate synthase